VRIIANEAGFPFKITGDRVMLQSNIGGRYDFDEICVRAGY
jgi:hypothetical protein